MPKARIKVGDFSGVKATAGFTTYDGPVPPKGLYHVRAKLWKLVENKSGNAMFKILLEINEPKGSDKAKYNGYAIWHNANLTEQGAPYINAMLDAFDINRKGVWANGGAGILLSREDTERVVSIAKKKVDGLEVLVTTKRDEWPKGSGDFSLKAVSFAPLNEADDDGGSDDDDEEESTEDAAPDDDDDDEPEDDDDPDEDDEDDDDDEDSF